VTYCSIVSVAKRGEWALANRYFDARAVQDRLDAVFGVDGWQDRYDLLPDGSAVCRLRCRVGERWVVKSDVGSPSEQPYEGERHKAAFSDALKRAAVKFGIGRYLYRLPRQWVDWDAQKRQCACVPTLPAATLPATIPAGPCRNGAAKPNPPVRETDGAPF
jgi:hypothetical protein